MRTLIIKLIQFIHISGDAGHYDEAGNLFVVDRIKDVLKYKGYQVSFGTVGQVKQLLIVMTGHLTTKTKTNIILFRY